MGTCMTRANALLQSSSILCKSWFFERRYSAWQLTVCNPQSGSCRSHAWTHHWWSCFAIVSWLALVDVPRCYPDLRYRGHRCPLPTRDFRSSPSYAKSPTVTLENRKIRTPFEARDATDIDQDIHEKELDSSTANDRSRADDAVYSHLQQFRIVSMFFEAEKQG